MKKLPILLLLLNVLFADVFDDAGEYVQPKKFTGSSGSVNGDFQTIIIDSNNHTIYNTRHHNSNKLFYGLSNGNIYTIKRARLNRHNKWVWISHKIRFNGNNRYGFSYMDLDLHNQLEQINRDKASYKDLLDICTSEKEYLSDKLEECRSRYDHSENDSYYSSLIPNKIYTIDHKGIKIELTLPQNIQRPFDVKINGFPYTIK